MKSVGLNNSDNKYLPKMQAKNNINFASNANLSRKIIQQDKIQINTQNKKKNTHKILIAIGVIGIGAATVIGILKGKQNKAKLLNSIPEDLRGSFSQIKGKTGDDFVDEAYKQMTKYLGLEGIAPSKITRKGNDSAITITGGFNPSKNTIGYSKGFFTKLNKSKQLNMLSHELRHCKQTADFLRTEGIGVDKYAEVWTESCMQQQLKDPVFRMTYKCAKNKQEAENIIEQLRKNTFEQIKSELEQNYSEALKLPKISANSDEGKAIYKLFEGCKNYEGLGMFGLGNESYKNNPLEIDAYNFGDKIEELFGNFIKATSKW